MTTWPKGEPAHASEPTGSATAVTLPRGVDYPYFAPLERYVFATSDRVPDFAIADRKPVLALGSNAAPLQLRRKFADLPGHIPVSRAVLFDHVVVYSAHFTRYGALPATLHRYAGAISFVAITWLDERQLPRMHETESVGQNYDYIEIEDIRLEHDGGLAEAAIPANLVVGAYVSRRGPVLHQGQPIRLAETGASNCPLPALTQPAALRFAQRRVAPELDFDTFLGRLAEDPAFRRECGARLRAH